MTSSDKCCHAINSPENPKKRKRCSSNTTSNSTLCSRHFKQDQVFTQTGIGKAVTLVEDSSSLGYIFGNEAGDDASDNVATKKRTQAALSIGELKAELLKLNLSVEGSKSVLRLRLEASRLGDFDLTKELVYSLNLDELRLYCFRYHLAYDGKKAVLIELLLSCVGGVAEKVE